jgi:rod shape-determining protein MreB
MAKDAGNGKDVIRLGFDWGTNTSVLKAEKDDTPFKLKEEICFTVVGYPKETVLPGILPKGKSLLFGQEAIDHRAYVDLVWPLDKSYKSGFLKDEKAAKDFAHHLRDTVDANHKHEVWASIGAPANADGQMTKDLRRCVMDAFERVVLAPEPFLAALGYRDDAKAGQPGYMDPVRHSLFVDIGAGTTDICLVQGYFPTREEQHSLNAAGNAVDAELRKMINRKYPDANMTGVRVTQVKEQNSFVGPATKKVEVTYTVSGRSRKLDLTEEVRQACETIMTPILDAIIALIPKADPDLVDALLRNIIVTGGGSLVGGILPYIEWRLHDAGMTTAKVRSVENYKELVAIGALKMARKVRDDQWQYPM